MPRTGTTCSVIAILLAFAASDPALARGKQGGRGGHAGHSAGHSGSHARGHTVPHRGFAGRARIGIFAGAPVFAAPFYYPPYYYAAPAYGASVQPPVQYIELFPDPQSRTPAWYYCAEAGAYYPYVQACPGGWQQVAGESPTTPPPPPTN